MNELLKEIMASHKKNGFDSFEEISVYIKKKIALSSLQYYLPEKELKRLLNFSSFEENIIKGVNKRKAKTVEKTPYFLGDIMQLSKVLQLAGISFGEEEWYNIRMALKMLAQEKKAAEVKFWGKVYTIENDYYVAYGALKEFENIKTKNDDIDKRGYEGLNKITIWVSHSPLEGWVELPEVSPEQISQSRFFKYIFSGDLNRPVKSFNTFNGQESHL
jgi:radial spoke head protein 4A